jgi:hypothetical protein
MTLRFLADNDTLLLKLKDNNYINKYKEETEDKDIKRKGIKVIDFDKGFNKDGSDKEQIEDKDIKGLAIDANKDLSEDESNKEESQDFN